MRLFGVWLEAAWLGAGADARAPIGRSAALIGAGPSPAAGGASRLRARLGRDPVRPGPARASLHPNAHRCALGTPALGAAPLLLPGAGRLVEFRGLPAPALPPGQKAGPRAMRAPQNRHFWSRHVTMFSSSLLVGWNGPLARLAQRPDVVPRPDSTFFLLAHSGRRL